MFTTLEFIDQWQRMHPVPLDQTHEAPSVSAAVNGGFLAFQYRCVPDNISNLYVNALMKVIESKTMCLGNSPD